MNNRRRIWKVTRLRGYSAFIILILGHCALTSGLHEQTTPFRRPSHLKRFLWNDSFIVNRSSRFTRTNAKRGIRREQGDSLKVLVQTIQWGDKEIKGHHYGRATAAISVFRDKKPSTKNLAWMWQEWACVDNRETYTTQKSFGCSPLGSCMD